MDSDRVQRVFANPHGDLHEIVTVRWARGVQTAGPPTSEFTWYPGYAWEVVLCAACASHLGWLFTATADREPARFYGLRRAAVTGV